MAYIAKTAFEARITNNDRENLSHIAGLFQAGGVNADCSAGLLCVRTNRVPCEGFGASVLNENTWYMNVAASTVTIDDVIYACDTYDNQLLGDGNGNQYFVGTKTLGLGVPSGRYGNFTRIDFDGQSVYRFGEGNVTFSDEDDTYFTIDDGALVSQTEKPASGLYFELRGTGSFVEGASNSFGYVDLVACKVSAGGSAYTLPAATASTLGGVKVGSGLAVTADGTLSVTSE